MGLSPPPVLSLLVPNSRASRATVRATAELGGEGGHKGGVGGA